MRRLASLATLLAALLAPVGASALSCRAPDPLRSFVAAQEAPERYALLYGQLDVDATLLPPPVQTEPMGRPARPEGPVPARFAGHALGFEGFDQPFETPLLLDVDCAGPWCGSIASGTWLLFVQADGDDWRLTLDPCGNWAFDNVAPATLDALGACLRGEGCEG